MENNQSESREPHEPTNSKGHYARLQGRRTAAVVLFVLIVAGGLTGLFLVFGTPSIITAEISPNVIAFGRTNTADVTCIVHDPLHIISYISVVLIHADKNQTLLAQGTQRTRNVFLVPISTRELSGQDSSIKLIAHWPFSGPLLESQQIPITVVHTNISFTLIQALAVATDMSADGGPVTISDATSSAPDKFQIIATAAPVPEGDPLEYMKAQLRGSDTVVQNEDVSVSGLKAHQLHYEDSYGPEEAYSNVVTFVIHDDKLHKFFVTFDRKTTRRSDLLKMYDNFLKSVRFSG